MKLTAEQVAGQFRNCATAGGVVESCFLDAADIVERNLIESPDERRERFERWMRHEYPEAVLGNSLCSEGGRYLMRWVESLWQVWNAAMDFGGGGGE